MHDNIIVKDINNKSFNILNKLSQIQKLKRLNDKTGINPLGRQLSNPLTCCLYFIAISLFISRTNLWFIGFIPVGFLTLKNYLTYYRSKRMRDKKENFYVNNTELQNKNVVLDEIINHYKDSMKISR